MFSQQARWDRKMPGDPREEWDRAEVLARFSGGRIYPMRFRAGGSLRTVAAIHYTWTERRGKALLYFFSVSDKSDSYRLCLDTETMAWHLATLQ